MGLFVLAVGLTFASPPLSVNCNDIATANPTAITTAMKGIDNVATAKNPVQMIGTESATTTTEASYIIGTTTAMEATNEDYAMIPTAITATTANTPPAPEVAFNVICPQDAMAAATASDEHRLLTGAPRKILDAVDNTDATVFRFAAVAV